MADWMDLGPADELADGQKRLHRAGTVDLVLCRVGEALCAVRNVCPHAGMPIGQGDLHGPILVCPFHGQAYDVRSGRNADFDDDILLETFPVRVTDAGRIEVQVEAPCMDTGTGDDPARRDAGAHLEPVWQHLASDKEAALDRLMLLLAIPSISTDPAYAGDVRRAAGLVRQTMAEIGLEADLHETEGHPVVVGRAAAADAIAPEAPHVLFYGHYDVQPADPEAEWRTPPFEPTVSDGAIRARGASDDKGQLSMFLEALRAWRQAHGRFPVPVTVVLEGEEECGSGGLTTFVEQHREQLGADFVLISDTAMWDPRTVAITYGLRGMLYFDLRLTGPSRDLHSGMYGGALANPANVLTRVLGRLLDDRQCVTIPHFYDDVDAPDDAERRRWSELGFDEMTDCLGPVGVERPHGEAGFTTLERRWIRPSCDVNGLNAGYTGAGAKTVIPASASAKVSFRLAPSQDPSTIAAHFRRWLADQDVHGCRWEIAELGRADPVVMPTDSPCVAAACRAIERSSGRPAALIREGATIPIVATFRRALGLESLLMGFALPDDCVHAPNEKFDLECFELGCRTHAAFLAELAAS